MIAFIKRRWFLMSCVFVLTALSMVDLQRITSLDLAFCAMVEGADRINLDEFGIKAGAFRVAWLPNSSFGEVERDFDERNLHFSLHRPQLGSMPEYKRRTRAIVSIPIWLPLCAVLGWLVIRELRWWEKRARVAEVIAQ